jgi:hypothetical protein
VADGADDLEIHRARVALEGDPAERMARLNPPAPPREPTPAWFGIAQTTPRQAQE